MGVIEPTNTAVKSLKGLHLYHCGRSNCSARVRLLIEEKGLPWTSHHFDLLARENVTEEYFGINPKGVVPTLVHDGRVVVESNDILLYLEEAFPEPSFTPKAAEDQEAMRIWLQRSGDLHIPAIKTFAYFKVNAKLAAKTPEEVALYRKLQKDPELLAFHAKHDLPGSSFSDEDVNNAVRLLREALGDMEQAIGRTGWLAGPDYSLADISWAPSILTLKGVGFPVDEFKGVMEWYGRITKRPAWERAQTMWAKPPVERVTEVRAAGAS